MAAVREVGEETGLRVRLGVPLASQSVPDGARGPRSSTTGSAASSATTTCRATWSNGEIDEVAWVTVEKADERLSYRRDRHTLREALATGKPPGRSSCCGTARPGRARPGASDDRKRPLLVAGDGPGAGRGAAARGVRRVADRDLIEHALRRDRARRTPSTAGWPITRTDGLSEEDASDASVLGVVDELLHSGEDAVLCTHRPGTAVGVRRDRDPARAACDRRARGRAPPAGPGARHRAAPRLIEAPSRRTSCVHVTVAREGVDVAIWAPEFTPRLPTPP